MKRELKTKPIYECRCDERLKPKGEESTCLAYTVVENPGIEAGTGFVYYESMKRGKSVWTCCLLLIFIINR
jgi:hypothetical protein